MNDNIDLCLEGVLEIKFRYSIGAKNVSEKFLFT